MEKLCKIAMTLKVQNQTGNMLAEDWMRHVMPREMSVGEKVYDLLPEKIQATPEADTLTYLFSVASPLEVVQPPVVIKDIEAELPRFTIAAFDYLRQNITGEIIPVKIEITSVYLVFQNEAGKELLMGPSVTDMPLINKKSSIMLYSCNPKLQYMDGREFATLDRFIDTAWKNLYLPEGSTMEDCVADCILRYSFDKDIEDYFITYTQKQETDGIDQDLEDDIHI